jgi:hypothetical protein
MFWDGGLGRVFGRRIGAGPTDGLPQPVTSRRFYLVEMDVMGQPVGKRAGEALAGVTATNRAAQ